jgi:hypothetical protein
LCPQETLAALKWDAIFDQFRHLSETRSEAAIAPKRMLAKIPSEVGLPARVKIITPSPSMPARQLSGIFFSYSVLSEKDSKERITIPKIF